MNTNIQTATIDKTKEDWKFGSWKIIPAMVLAVLPIFSPYSLVGPISLNMVIMGIYTAVLMALNGRFFIALPVVYMWILHFSLSVLAFFSTDYNIALFNSMLSISYSVICFSMLWSSCDRETFVKYTNYVGMGCCLFLFYQALFLAAGGEPPSGQLFNLPLLDYAGWVSTTWGYRLNSMFQEPSYFAIFCLPLLVVNMQKNNYKLSLIYILALILSSSSLGILGTFLVVVYYFFFKKGNLKQFIVVVLFTLVIHSILIYFSDYYNYVLQRSFDKVLAVFAENDSSRIRLIGQLFLFENLPEFNQLFGVGINQMKNYFTSVGANVFNYSNSFVVTLINTGIIGLLVYIAFHVLTAYRCYKADRFIFYLIFIMICAIDYFIYSVFFFYLLTFIYLKNEKELFDE